MKCKYCGEEMRLIAILVPSRKLDTLKRYVLILKKVM